MECDDSSIQEEFEDKFSKLIGSGYGVSFATGRMGFYALLKLLKIGKDDEVILLGSTCSVMVNAILRCNATPIYSDINTENYGSDKESILLKISKNTKMIIAQHSFGIPCDILKIKELAAQETFYFEDCALTIGLKLIIKYVVILDASCFN